MKIRAPFLLFLVLTLVSVTGCDVLGGIFRTGVGLGIIIAVVIILLILFIIRAARGRR
jgi:hypothetical protein